MSDRAALARSFLGQTDWAEARMTLLAGDASNRKYFRLELSGSGTAVLMDAPPERGEDVAPFVTIARYLKGIGLSAPEILASDESHGFLLLEDLGDALFARVIAQDAALEEPLYAAATDALITLHAEKPPDLALYDAAQMADMAALAFDWYADGLGHNNHAARNRLHSTIGDALDRHALPCDVLIQRDYHAENLLWLPDRVGVAQVGLLDFQDAMLGHRAYDLVSLLQDARRDVSPDTEGRMLRRYIDRTGMRHDDFVTAYRCLGAQRNLRIIGVFARLCLRDGKPGYLDLIPRVWAHLQKDLDHPALPAVAAALRDSLPPPTPLALQDLKEKCATIPAQ